MNNEIGQAVQRIPDPPNFQVGTPEYQGYLDNIPTRRLFIEGEFYPFKVAQDPTQRDFLLQNDKFTEFRPGLFVPTSSSDDYQAISSYQIADSSQETVETTLAYQPRCGLSVFDQDPLTRHKASLGIIEECAEYTLNEVARFYRAKDRNGELYEITVSHLPEGSYTEDQIEQLVKVVSWGNLALPEVDRIQEISFTHDNCGGSTRYKSRQLRLSAAPQDFERVLHTVVHEMGHIVEDIRTNAQKTIWDTIWAYSLGNNASEIFDDSNYGPWNNRYGHPVDRALFGSSELFASTFAAVVLHPEQLKTFMKHKDTNPQMKLLGEVAIQQMAQLGLVNADSPLFAYVQNKEEAMAQLNELQQAIPDQILAALKSPDVNTVKVASRAIRYWPHENVISTLLDYLNNDALVLGMSLTGQRMALLKALDVVRDKNRELVEKRLPTSILLSWADNADWVDRWGYIQRLMRNGISLDSMLESPELDSRKKVAEAIVHHGTTAQREKLYHWHDNDQYDLRLLAYQAMIPLEQRSLSGRRSRPSMLADDDPRLPMARNVLTRAINPTGSPEMDLAIKAMFFLNHRSFFRSYTAYLETLPENDAKLRYIIQHKRSFKLLLVRIIGNETDQSFLQAELDRLDAMPEEGPGRIKQVVLEVREYLRERLRKLS